MTRDESACSFTREGQQIRCVHCDKSYAWPAGKEPPHRHCDAEHVGPPLWQRATNFAKAIFSQAALGAEAFLSDEEIKLVRSPEEIEAIAATCKACPLFNGSICTHGNCGCPIDADRSYWWSKIAWKSQRCPDDPPRWQ